MSAMLEDEPDGARAVPIHKNIEIQRLEMMEFEMGRISQRG
jgi:hypothetical protein